MYGDAESTCQVPGGQGDGLQRAQVCLEDLRRLQAAEKRLADMKAKKAGAKKQAL